MAHIDMPDTQRANRRFVKSAMAAPLLTADHEHELAQRWRENGDEAALHELVSAYIRLVVATASRFRNYGLPIGDLVQEGNIGLMQAAARFEPQRNIRFATYATWWIRSAMQDFVLRNWSIVRTGTTSAHKSLFFNLRRLRARIERHGAATGTGAMTDAVRRRIATELKVEVGDVEQMESRLASDRSLNTPISEDGETDWQDLLADERPSPEETVQARHDGAARARWLRDALAYLSPRERRIITERRLRDESSTLQSLGNNLGISKERVRHHDQDRPR